MAKTSTADILIRARDEASKKLTAIAKSANFMTSAFKTAAIGAAAYLSVRTLTNFAKESLSLYAKQVDAEIKLEQAYRATSGAVGIATDDLKKYASELQKVTRFGDEVIIDGMSILATFKNLQGDGFKRTTELALDLTTAMGGGTESLKTVMIQLGKALNDPLIGMTALQRVGVSFSAQQVEMVKQLVNTNRLVDAQKIIMDELSAQFGGQARAAVGSYAGAVARMSNAIGDLKERIGQALTPTMTRFADSMRLWAENNADRMYEWVAKGISYAELFKDSLTALIDYMKTDFKGGFQWVWDSFLKVMKQAIFSAIDLAAVAGKGIFEAVNDGLVSGRERRIDAEAEKIYKERGGPTTTSGVRQTPTDATLYNQAFQEAIERENKRQSEKKESLFGPVLKKIEEDAKKLGKDLVDTMPTAFGETFDKLFKEHQQRIAAIAAGNYGKPGQPGNKLLGGFGDAVSSMLGGKAGVSPLEARFLTGVGQAADPAADTARNTERIAKNSERQLALLQRLAERDARRQEHLAGMSLQPAFAAAMLF